MATNIGKFINSIRVKIVHIPTGLSVDFPSFLISFTDSYKLSTTSQNVYGRMDPIVNYKNTARIITFSIVIPSASLEEAKENNDKIANLIKFQYPVYSDSEKASGISAPPMCKIRFTNMINEYGDYLSGYFAGVDYAPVNESGYFIENDSLYAKEYKLNLSFTVLHTKALGWSSAGKDLKWKSGKYPYNLSISSSPDPATGQNSTEDNAASAVPSVNAVLRKQQRAMGGE